MPKAASLAAGTPYAVNDKLGNIELIGLGQVESPEDVILDADDHLYCGTRHGDIVKFHAPDYQRNEVYAHIGGQPLGMAFSATGDLYICVGGMGLYRVRRADRVVEKVTDETNRSWNTVNDDSRCALRMIWISHRMGASIFRSDHTLRNERVVHRQLGSARQRTHHLLRPENRKNPNGTQKPGLPQRRLHGGRWGVAAVC